MRSWLWLPLALVLVSCGSGPPAGDEPVHIAAAPAVHQELHLEPGLADRWGIVTVPVALSDLAADEVLPGVVALDQDRTALISPLLSGQIAAVEADLGDAVTAGRPLLTLNAPEFTRAQSDFLDLLTRASLARREYERALALQAEQALEEREFLRRQSEFEGLVTELVAAESLLHAFGLDHDRIEEIKARCREALTGDRDCEVAGSLLVLRAPITGTVIQREAVLGENVGPERLLFTITDLTRLWVLLDAYEDQLVGVRVGTGVVIHGETLGEERIEGHITWISDVVDERLRTVRLRVAVRDPGGRLRPNTFVTGHLQGRLARPLPAVPDEAVQYLEGEPFVFVQEPSEPGEDYRVFAVRHIRPGALVAGRRLVLEGLEAGEAVVARGAFTLKAELTKSAGGQDHVH
jgi:cobalt-zinc-cadmium efflux system membrane fusion protein